MRKVAIYGIGMFGVRVLRWCKKNNIEVIVAFDKNVKQTSNWNGITVTSPSDINMFEFDIVYISALGKENVLDIKANIIQHHITEDKIVAVVENDELMKSILKDSYYDEKTDHRVSWIRDLSKYFKDQNVEGDIAECGVNWGDFAMFINKYFPTKNLYLFDTYEGFDDRDLEFEVSLGNKAFIDGPYNIKAFNKDKVDYILDRMPESKMCHIKKGYFPDSTEGLESNKFCFVNLDMDLYKPQLAGLNYFYDLLVPGGGDIAA